MELEDFFNKVNEHPDLEGDILDQGIVIRCKSKNLCSKVSVVSITDHEWDTLEKVLTGEQEPHTLNHVSRIVGYFSQVHNWNKSKLSELADRQKGNYEI